VARLTLKLEGETSSDLSLVVNGFFIPFALSPDGERLVFRARGAKGSQLWLREFSGFETKALPGTALATTPFFSPDGQWVGFWRAEDRILRKTSIAGGAPIELGATDAPQNALWGLSDEIVFETGYPEGELWSIPADGGKAQPIPIRDRSKGERISLRALIPGGKDLLVASIGPGGTWLDALSRVTGQRHRLLRGGSNVLTRYTRTGHLVYGDGDALFAAPVNEQFEPVGPAIPVLHGIDHFFRHSNGAISANGTVVYLPAERIREGELAWLDREGHITVVAGGQAPFYSVALSPDGRQAAADLVDGTKLQVWIFDLERGAKRLLGSAGQSIQPIWSRDGTSVTYVSDREGATGLYRKRADGTGEEEFLVRRPNTWLIPEDWSPDGQSLLFSEPTGRGDTDVWLYSGGKATPLLATGFNEASARFSPDGRFIAFDADDGGVNHVYVQPFPAGPRTPISIEEAGWPQWTADGRQLLFKSGSRIMVVDIQTHPTLRVGQPRLLLKDEPGAWRTVAVTPDGRRLTLSPRSMEGPLELRVILNWFEELERLAPHPGHLTR
jgi:eukaryotic-like serine/threonine-protein kinase